jgi:hypothetical protein
MAKRGSRFGLKGQAWTLRIVSTLREQGPQSFEKMVAEGMALVPPGRAFRAAEAQRVKVYRSMGRPTNRIYNTDQDKIIRTGARHLVVQAISPLLKQEKLVKWWDNERGEYMLRIGDNYESRWQRGIHCDTCGAEIYSNSSHDYVACYCEPPLYVDGGIDNPRVGIPSKGAKYHNIKRRIRMEKLPTFYRLELSMTGRKIQESYREVWVEEDTQPL